MNTMAVGAVRIAGQGTRSECLVDDGLDRARAATAFRAAAQAAIDLLGVTWKVVCTAHGIADIMVTQDVAGTDDHKNTMAFGDAAISKYETAPHDAKGKSVVSSNSKLPVAD
jgi:hypothetical protein